MSVSLWRWSESCEGFCHGDCDLCTKEVNDEEDEEEDALRPDTEAHADA